MAGLPEGLARFSKREAKLNSTGHSKPRILIGPAANDPSESVSVVNRAFMGGLGASYQFIPLPADRKHGGFRRGTRSIINTYYFVKQLMAWVLCLVRFRPAIVHYAVTDGWAMEKGFIFLAIGRLFGAKTLGHLHSGVFIEFWNALPPWRKKNGLRALRRLDGLVVLSEGWRRNVRQTVSLDDRRVFVVNNPIDAAFEQAALRMPADRPGNSILSLGALEGTKGVMDLLQAAQRLRGSVDFKLRVVGPEREAGLVRSMENYIRQHDLSHNASIGDGTWGQEKIGLFAQSNIFVLASYFENFPLVVLEAAAAGMAIIATPVGAVPEFFENDVSAIFVQPGDIGQLAEAIRTLVCAPDKRLRLAAAAREVFQRRCARRRIMQSLDNVYQNLTASMDGPPVPVLAGK
jgi:glycosyltransferase involved in cell wall biosynthesis